MMPGTIIESGIIFLLIFSPLALGGVSSRSVTLYEIVSAGLLFFWGIHTLLHRQRHHRRSVPLNPAKPPVLAVPGRVCLGAFVLLILFQLVPLPEGLVNTISPVTHQVYAEAVEALDMPLPRWFPLSVCSQATETELYKLLVYIAVFFLSLQTIRTPRQVKRLLIAIIAIGFLEALYGLLQFVSGQHQIYTYQASSWVSGTFVNKNHFAGYMELAIFLTAGFLFFYIRPHRYPEAPSSSQRPLEERWMKILALLFMLGIMVSAQLLSGSKGGVVSLFGGLLCFVFLAFRAQFFSRRLVVVVLLFPLLLGLLVFTTHPGLFGRRVDNLHTLTTHSSLRVRAELWKTSLNIFQDFPAVGAGFGTFSHLSRRYKTFRWNLHYQYAENDYAQLLAETGVIGGGLLACVAVVFFARVFRQWKHHLSHWTLISVGGVSALWSLLIHSAMDFQLHIPANALLFTVIAAITCVIGSHGFLSGHHHISQARTQRGTFFLGWAGIGLIVIYLYCVITTHYAFELSKKGAGSVKRQEEPTAILQRAIHYDQNHGAYYYTLGSYLAQHVDQKALGPSGNESGAEPWLTQAVLHDPANPWYYYELGMLTYERGECQQPRGTPARRTDCPVSAYFLAALQNAPKNMFLRKAVGTWLYYHDDPEKAFHLMREIVSSDLENPFQAPGVSQEFAKFLYEIHLDYESDLEMMVPRESRMEMKECRQPQFLPSLDPLRIELGADDGTAEWKTSLLTPDDRVKKVICLPEALDEYQAAAVKIFMNSAGAGQGKVWISLDDHLLPLETLQVSSSATWYEIPVDLDLLQNKSMVHIYVRSGTRAATGNALHIWGDQDSSLRRSVFRFNERDDLSNDDGTQTGEYLIRLVLTRKSGAAHERPLP